MHILAGFAVLATLIGFAFGQNTARLFVGALLGLGACAVLGILAIAVIDIQRQSMVTTKIVHMGPAR